MNLNAQIRLRSNYRNINFLRENSYWYKYLNRSEMYFKEFEKEMKRKYKLTSKDKLERLEENLDRISKFIDIFS